MSDRPRGPRGPMGRGAGPAEKPKNMGQALRRLVRYFGARRKHLVVVFALSILSTAFGIIGPKLQGKVTTRLFEGFIGKYVAAFSGKPLPAIDFVFIERLLALIVGLYLVSSLLRYLQQLIMSDVAQKVVYDMREEVHNKIHSLPLQYFDSRSHGEVMSRVTNDIDTIANTLQQSVTQFITAFATILGIVVMMLTISPLLTLVSLLTLPTAMLATVRITKISQRHFAAQQKELGELNGHVEEMYSGFTIVKAFGREADAVERHGAINDRLGEAGWRAQFISGIVMPIMTFINNVGYVAICVVGGVLTARNVIEIGDIQAFIQYSRRFTMPIAQLSNIANVLQSTLASAERVFEILDEEDMVEDRPDARDAFVPRGDVAFHDLKFGYTDDHLLMDGVSLEVAAGETVAIVGPTGAGKTTLVNLLMRFYEIKGGAITIDGVDLRDLRRSSLRNIFGMVLQDTWLFGGTIRENIAYGRDEATEDSIFTSTSGPTRRNATIEPGVKVEANDSAKNESTLEQIETTIASAIMATIDSAGFDPIANSTSRGIST